MFTWSSVSQNCPATYYNIKTNCGQCPDATDANSVACNITDSTLLLTCILTIQTVICGHIYGKSSNFVAILKKG